MFGVAVGAGVRGHGDGAAGDVHQPRLGYAGSRIARHLLNAVVAERGIRDLDDEQDVARLEVTIGVVDTTFAARPHTRVVVTTGSSGVR